MTTPGSETMHPIKKVVAGLGVLCFALVLLLVRDRSAVDHDGAIVEIWYVTGQEEDGLPETGWFNESQDSLYVKAVGMPFLQIEQKFLTSVVGESAPDLFEYFGSVAQWSSRGALLPLDGFMERDGFDRSRVFPALWDEMTWDGETFAVPIGTACEAFYWNKEHFREAGLDPDRAPRNWKELEKYAKRLAVRDESGEIVRAGYIPGYWKATTAPLPLFLFWPLQLGAKFLSPDGTQVNMTSEACVEALEWEAGLFERLGGQELRELQGSFGYGAEHGFMNEGVSMLCQKSSFVGELRRFAPDLEYGCAPFPVREGAEPAVNSGSVWIGIPATAEHPEEAWEYIRYVSQTSIQTRAAEYAVEKNRVGFFPANIEAAKSPVQMSVPHMDIFIDSMEWAHTPNVIPLAHVVFWREYALAWDSAVRGAKSPREALETAEAQVQRALDDQIEYELYFREKRDEKNKKRIGL